MQGLKGVWVKNRGVKIVKSGCVRKNCGYFSNGATLEIPFFKNNFAFRSFSVSFFFRSNKDGGGFIFNGCAASSRWSLSAGYRGRYVTTKMNDVNKQLDVGTNVSFLVSNVFIYSQADFHILCKQCSLCMHA